MSRRGPSGIGGVGPRARSPTTPRGFSKISAQPPYSVEGKDTLGSFGIPAEMGIAEEAPLANGHGGPFYRGSDGSEGSRWSGTPCSPADDPPWKPRNLGATHDPIKNTDTLASFGIPRESGFPEALSVASGHGDPFHHEPPGTEGPRGAGLRARQLKIPRGVPGILTQLYTGSRERSRWVRSVLRPRPGFRRWRRWQTGTESRSTGRPMGPRGPGGAGPRARPPTTPRGKP